MRIKRKKSHAEQLLTSHYTHYMPIFNSLSVPSLEMMSEWRSDKKLMTTTAAIEIFSPFDDFPLFLHAPQKNK